MAQALFFLKGLIVGFSIAAPVGPIGVLCIRRTLARGRFSGLVSGMGAATADATYGLIGALGLTIISNVLISQQYLLRLIGGIFLLYLGTRTFLSKPSSNVDGATKVTGAGDYTSTLFLTLTNPTTILSFTAVFAGLGLGSGDGSYASAVSLVSGVFLGSSLWWLILSETVNVLRGKISPTALTWVNRVSGGVICSFGIIALLGLLKWQ